ncbi:PREDICTED: 21 kDa protein-like [Camelina sativa]|uniref:21 kDa protein-like n=1 Tax=Camelina sativa TaxID=90675 RepID=A0ABM0VMU5_CAMSA|nr:PREDICTED: 21 kDa protein-like [Camelina sativa]
MTKQYQALFLLFSVPFLFSSELTAAKVSPAGTSAKALSFIQSSCKSTTYQSLCVETLSVYANTINTSPRRIVDTAIAVSLNQALSTKLFLSHLTKSQFRTLADCQPTADVFTTDCTCSVQELQEVVRCTTWTECLFHVNNAEVCAISAESYSVENSCSSPFAGPVKMSVRGRISDAVRKSLHARFAKLHHEINNAKMLFKAFRKN